MSKPNTSFKLDPLFARPSDVSSAACCGSRRRYTRAWIYGEYLAPATNLEGACANDLSCVVGASEGW